MSYKERTKAELALVLPVGHNCPAHGCPNAASTSFDGSRWACYYHAKAPSEDWPKTTTQIRQDWPASCNWNHPDKVAYDAELAARRIANRPVPARYAGNMASIIGDVA